MKEKCAILDCGGQYTKVIDRKVRELGVYTDIFPMGVRADKLKEYGALFSPADLPAYGRRERPPTTRRSFR